MKLVNLTPHALHIENGKKVIEIPASGIVARIEDEVLSVFEMDGFVFCDLRRKEISGLPSPQEGTIYIVSRPLAMMLKGRSDVVFCDEFERDEEGKIRYARALSRYKGESNV